MQHDRSGTQGTSHLRLWPEPTGAPQHVAETGMTTSADAKSKRVEVNPYHFWHARFWHGMPLGAWARLLARNRFRIGLTKWGLAGTISMASVMNSALRPLQELLLKKHLERMQIKDAPIFIVGHWRSGTTLLHELMVSGRALYLSHDVPVPGAEPLSDQRVVSDQVQVPAPLQAAHGQHGAGFDRPQEDEFALCNMGLPSPYLTMAFPNEPPHDSQYLTLEGLSPQELDAWKQGLEWFLKRVTFRDPKRIILKSPPHTGRIKTLLELFPDARFVHIVRDPYPLFGSTVKLWKTLYKFEALQDAKHEGLEEYVFSCFEKMYGQFERDRELVDPARFFEVRYEDLVARADRADAGVVRTPRARRIRDRAPQARRPTSPIARTIAPAATRFPTSYARRSTSAGDPTCAATATASRTQPRRPASRKRLNAGSDEFAAWTTRLADRIDWTDLSRAKWQSLGGR